jgi:hypothetical protein
LSRIPLRGTGFPWRRQVPVSVGTCLPVTDGCALHRAE